MRIVIASQTAKRQSMTELEELGYGCPPAEVSKPLYN